MTRAVIAGIDGSERALEAAAFAADEAPRRGAPLHPINAVPGPYDAVVRDRPTRALVAASLTAKLVALGHHARRSPGSTTHGVMHRAGCPVVVVPLSSRGSR
jgi:nucleotide-binding universal stress UspA family protein